jgi:hypothetical protein
MPINLKFDGSLDCFSDVSSFLRKRDYPVLSLTLIFLSTPPPPPICTSHDFPFCYSNTSSFGRLMRHSSTVFLRDVLFALIFFIETCHFYAYSEFITIRLLTCCACKKKTPFNLVGSKGSCGVEPRNILCLTFDGETEPFQRWL